MTNPTPTPITPKEVMVSGTVTVEAYGVAENITFTNTVNSKTYVAEVIDGRYSIALPNGNVYSTIITWTWWYTTQHQNGGLVDLLNTTEASITRNLPLPDAGYEV